MPSMDRRSDRHSRPSREEEAKREGADQLAGGASDMVEQAGVEAEPARDEESELHHLQHVLDYPAFTKHYENHFARRGHSYDEYGPAYQYGWELAANFPERVAWRAVEADARAHWEEQNPGTWDDLKEAIRYGWEQARQHVSEEQPGGRKVVSSEPCKDERKDHRSVDEQRPPGIP